MDLLTQSSIMLRRHTIPANNDRHPIDHQAPKPKERVDDRGFTFLTILAAIVCYHLYAIPDKSLWAGDLQLSPVFYSVGGLVGQGLIAILYGAPYSAIVISGIDSSVAFILGLAKLAGLYDWVEKLSFKFETSGTN
ncbi:unnamed protein product [Adineta ricciae]|uniref:Uncharacterized protein n=1 Tax=Adineta ricciae TaxID=249248 RepID=A0A815W833_ADIRI|nr:unnamed protein product [Adineta ricciae]